MSFYTFTNGTVADATQVNSNFTFNFDDINTNSSIFCELLSGGDISTTNIDKLIYNTSLSLTNNNGYTKQWSDILPNFSSFKYYNKNAGITTDEIEIFYEDTSGNLIAGRINYLTDTFTQTHSISSSDQPTTSGDSTYTVLDWAYTKYMLTENNRLIIFIMNSYNNPTTHNPKALFVDAKIYDTDGSELSTYHQRIYEVNNASVNDNHIYRYTGVNSTTGYYTSGNTANSYAFFEDRHDDSSHENRQYKLVKITYNGSTFSVSAQQLFEVGDDQSGISNEENYIYDNKLYIIVRGWEDDGASNDYIYVDMYFYKLDLTSMTLSTLQHYSDSGIEGNSIVHYLTPDGTLLEFHSTDNSSYRKYYFYHYSGDSLLTTYNNHGTYYSDSISLQNMPYGYEYYYDVHYSGTTYITYFKAYDVINNTSTNISQYSSLKSPSSTYSYEGYFKIIDTSNNKHILQFTTTGYLVNDRLTGNAYGTDSITTTSANKIFMYAKPFINSFWVDLNDNIQIQATLNNGVSDITVDGLSWGEYNNDITQVKLNLSYLGGPLQGSNVAYYMLYN